MKGSVLNQYECALNYGTIRRCDNPDPLCNNRHHNMILKACIAGNFNESNLIASANYIINGEGNHDDFILKLIHKYM